MFSYIPVFLNLVSNKQQIHSSFLKKLVSNEEILFRNVMTRWPGIWVFYLHKELHFVLLLLLLGRVLEPIKINSEKQYLKICIKNKFGWYKDGLFNNHATAVTHLLANSELQPQLHSLQKKVTQKWIKDSKVKL